MATKSAYGLCVNNWIHGPTQKTSRMPLILLNETLKARVEERTRRSPTSKALGKQFKEAYKAELHSSL